MLKKVLVTIALLAILGLVVTGCSNLTPSPSPPKVFAKLFGGSGSERANSVHQTLDGGFIVAGGTRLGSGGDDFLLLKLDPSGNIEWKKTFGVDNYDYAYSVQQTSDGGFIAAGGTYSSDSDSIDLLLLKLDPSGNIKWKKTFKGTILDCSLPCVLPTYPYFVRQTLDGGLITGSGSSLLIKLDSSGNIVWKKKLSVGIFPVQETSDGGFIAVGVNSPSSDAFDLDLLILKIDPSGDIVWNKTFGGTSFDYANSIQQTSDGGFIVAGSTYSFGAGNGDLFLLKLDSNGNVEWKKTLGGKGLDFANSVQQTLDGGFIVAGSFSNNFDPSSDLILLRLDLSGNIIWNKRFDGDLFDRANSVQQTSDGGFIVAGETFRRYGFYLLLLKLDPSGNIPGCSYLRDISDITVTDPALSESRDFSLSASEPSTGLVEVSDVIVTDPALTVIDICQ